MRSLVTDKVKETKKTLTFAVFSVRMKFVSNFALTTVAAEGVHADVRTAVFGRLAFVKF